MFCGDWYHNRSEISVNTLQVSADILTILEDFNLIMIVGNHDIFYKHRLDVNSLSIFKNRRNVSIVDSVSTIEAFDRTITLCPWATEIADIPKSDVVFGHFEIETFKMNTYKVCEDGLKVSELLKKSPLVVSGHFHTRHEKKYSAGTVLYVGNPFQTDFGDVDNMKGYHIFDLDSLQYKFYENTISPQYRKVNLSDLIKHSGINDTIREIFKGNIVKLKIDRNIAQEDLNILTPILNQLGAESLAIDFDLMGVTESDNLLEKDLSGIDIIHAIEEFVSLLDIDDKRGVLDYTLELFNKCNE